MKLCESSGKVIFESRGDARASTQNQGIKSMAKRRRTTSTPKLYVYKCRDCQGFHITKVSQIRNRYED